MQPILTVSDIRRSYVIGKQTLDVLKGVSLTLAPRETVAVMGQSGSGKSTLLHVMGGLDKPSSGEVQFNGESIYKMSANKRSRFRATRVGFLFQAFHLLPELDLVENVMLPALALGQGRRSAMERARSLLDEVGLGERTHHRPQELSGGEQQRIAIARALVVDPLILLADEPSGNLDQAVTFEIMDLFKHANARGTTVLLATHDHSLNQRFPRRVLTLDQGLLVGDQRPLPM